MWWVGGGGGGGWWLYSHFHVKPVVLRLGWGFDIHFVMFSNKLVTYLFIIILANLIVQIVAKLNVFCMHMHTLTK